MSACRSTFNAVVIVVAMLCACAAFGQSGNTTNGYAKQVLLLMGSRFEFGAYAASDAQAEAAVAAGIAEVERIEALISSWTTTSQTSKINTAAGLSAVVVDDELYRLIARCHKISALTDGAFDLTAGGLNALYRFGGQDTTLPGAARLRQALSSVDYTAIELDAGSSSVALTRPGMRIGFGAIGKGYAANRARAIMRAMPGVRGGVVNAAGDIATFGVSGDSAEWTIAIADPRHADRWLGQLALRGESAVVTSGDYERYFTAEGVRYAHIIDPHTALPTTAVRSATVVCADAEVADALATALFVLGPDAGIELLDGLRDIEGLVVDAGGALFTSNGLILQPHAEP